MYELIVLSLLMRVSMHGYLIARIVNDIIGPYARLSNGRLYPLLAKLEESGLIEVDEAVTKEQHSERPSRSYRITEVGRKRFHTLMMDTTSNLGEYQRLFLQKVEMFHFLKPSERLYLIDHYINYCQAHVLHLTAEREDLAEGHYHHFEGDEDVLPATLDVMRHMAEQWKLETSWALRLRKREQLRQYRSDHLNKDARDVEPLDCARQNRQENEQENSAQED